MSDNKSLMKMIQESQVKTCKLCGDKPEFAEIKKTLLTPIKIKQEIDELNNSLVESMVVIENPKIEINELRKQIVMPVSLALKNAKDEYSKNLRKDLITLRKAIEEQATLVNNLITSSNENIKSFYDPLNETRANLRKYLAEFIKTLDSIRKTVEVEQNGYDQIDTSNFEEAQKQKYEEGKKAIIEKIQIFSKSTDNLREKYEKSVNEYISKVNKFIGAYKILIEIIKELSKTVMAGFKTYESSYEVWKNLEDKEKVSKTFEEIKKPLENILKSIQDHQADFMNMETILASLNKEESKEKEMKEEMEKICKDLTTQSNEILEEIKKIRVELKQPKLVIEPTSVVPPENQISSGFNKLEAALHKASNHAKKQMDENKDKADKSLCETRIDLMFIMDITNSMVNYLNQAKDMILKVEKGIREKCAAANVFIGFVGYRDFISGDIAGDNNNSSINGNNNDYVDIEFTKEHIDVRDKIKIVECEGGGDVPEDLAGAFEMAIRKDWKGKTRFAVLVTDAPCHGEKYHDLRGEDCGDNFPDGDPKNRNIEDFIKQFAEKNINLFCLQIDKITEKMFGIFNKTFNDYKNKNKNCNSNIHFINFDESEDKLEELVINEASKLYSNAREN